MTSFIDRLAILGATPARENFRAVLKTTRGELFFVKVKIEPPVNINDMTESAENIVHKCWSINWQDVVNKNNKINVQDFIELILPDRQYKIIARRVNKKRAFFTTVEK